MEFFGDHELSFLNNTLYLLKNIQLGNTLPEYQQYGSKFSVTFDREKTDHIEVKIIMFHDGSMSVKEGYAPSALIRYYSSINEIYMTTFVGESAKKTIKYDIVELLKMENEIQQAVVEALNFFKEYTDVKSRS